MKKAIQHLRKSLRYGATIVALLISAGLLAQQTSFRTISGIIKDRNTKERIIFASVSIPGTNIGTVSNSDGEFTLKIPVDINQTQFELSHLGYKNKRIAIDEAISKGRKKKVFYIEPASIELKGVIVRPNDPEQIVSAAIDKIGQNYSNKANSLTGFYREAIKQRRSYVSIAEAIVEIYKTPYTFSLDADRVKILKGRKSSNVKRSDTLLVKMQGGPHVSLFLDVVRHPELIFSHEDMPNYNYQLEDIVILNDEATYVISFEPNARLEYPLYYGKLYISVESLALTMANFSMDLSDIGMATRAFVRRKPAGLIFQPINTSYLVTYKKQGDRYYINYMRSEIKFRADWRKRIFKTYYTVMSEMAITERSEEKAQKIRYKESFHRFTVLTDRINEYFDKDFWGSYNIIKPDESIQSAIRKFNRRFKKRK